MDDRPVYYLCRQQFNTTEEYEATFNALQECGFCIVSFSDGNDSGIEEAVIKLIDSHCQTEG